MFLGKYCGGCGNGNQSCKIAKCSLEQGKIEYCYECKHYPCEKYQYIDEYDSFITHRRQKSDLEKAQSSSVNCKSIWTNISIVRGGKGESLYCSSRFSRIK